MLTISRRNGETLQLDGLGLARGFFRGDPSSVGVGAYDSLTGRGDLGRITVADIQAINRTMRARSKHDWWAPVLDRELDWLAALDPEVDLIDTEDAEWDEVGAEDLVRAALEATIGPWRGPSVATKVLHLKRPRLFPVLDDFVAVMLGVNMPDDAPAARKVRIAVELVLHLRAEGRRNLSQLRAIKERLAAEGTERSLVRILDAILWSSHPATNVPGLTRAFSVETEQPGRGSPNVASR